MWVLECVWRYLLVCVCVLVSVCVCMSVCVTVYYIMEIPFDTSETMSVGVDGCLRCVCVCVCVRVVCVCMCV